MKNRKHTVLFVDDDPLVLRGISRSSDDFPDWDFEFASTSNAALEKLRSKPFDALVTDMLMPGLDGPQLLELVSQEMPTVLRFMLTGNIRNAQVLRVVSLVHQMIPKPSDLENIYAVVERACRLRDLLSDPQLLGIITGIKTLPSVPSLYRQLTQELQSNDPNPQRVGAVIAQDSAMTAKILQLVNSAFFGLAARVSSPQRAVSILGLNTIKSLVLGIDVFAGYRGLRNLPISVDALWLHSVLVSNLSFLIARSLKLSAAEQEEARVSGILHDVGKLLQLHIPDFFQRVPPDPQGLISVQAEYAAYGTSHAEMGGYLLGIWGLPASIVEVVTFHHKPADMLNQKPGLVTALHLANGLLNMWKNARCEQFEDFVDLTYLEQIGLTDQLSDWSQSAQILLSDTSGIA